MRKSPTLKDDLKEYLEYKESILRDDSYKVYKLFGKKFLSFLEAKKQAETQTKNVTPKLCENYKRHILKLHKHSTTRNKEIAQMKTFFYQFTKSGWERYKVSPAANIELLPRQDSEMHEPYTDEQAALIIGKTIEKRDYFLLLCIYLIHYTFARPGREVRLIKVSDIKQRSILIRPENSKNRRTKTPTIAKPVEQLIEYLGIKNMPNNYYVFGANGCPGVKPCGRNMYYNRHKQILKELIAEKHYSLIGNYTLYGWKHTGNIRAITLGINERELQFQNGFRDHRTLEIYIRKLSAYMSSEIYDKFV